MGGQGFAPRLLVRRFLIRHLGCTLKPNHWSPSTSHSSTSSTLQTPLARGDAPAPGQQMAAGEPRTLKGPSQPGPTQTGPAIRPYRRYTVDASATPTPSQGATFSGEAPAGAGRVFESAMYPRCIHDVSPMWPDSRPRLSRPRVGSLEYPSFWMGLGSSVALISLD